jgi:tetratricopeptide (TPR) repeat protein
MQAETIVKLMTGQMPFDAQTLPDLQNLVEEYPYFQAAQLLYTLNLRAVKDSRFNAELRKTACLSGDRKKLFFQAENGYFSPAAIEKLENREEAAPDDSFSRIDSFLAEKNQKEEKEEIPAEYVRYLLSEPAQNQPAEPAPLHHQDTIDKFLEEDRKSPVKIVLTPPDTAGNEVFHNLDQVEEGSFFSETLAKIYLKQKKYEKALEIIRKLNLIYPEKNRYFADQIRFLEKLIINTKK